MLTQLAVDFDAFLQYAHDSTHTEVDQHFKSMAGCILVSNVFLDFVDSYSTQDSIGAEHGYQKFVSFWKMNDQVKYVQCWIEQLVQINLTKDGCPYGTAARTT